MAWRQIERGSDVVLKTFAFIMWVRGAAEGKNVG